MPQLIRAFVCCFAALILATFASAAWGQSVPVYVSGGPNIYKVSGGAFTTVLTVSGANFESLAVGPDNADTDSSGNAVHAFLLYACDTANNKIYRFDPATPSQTQLVYNNNGPAFITPECGRSTSTGDFYVTNKAGGGVFQLIANIGTATVPLSNFPFSVSPAGASAISVSASSTMTGRGITQKYVGDLLVVDNAENQVLRSPFGNFSTLSTFISNPAAPNAPVLSSPVGIARISTGEVLVANSVLGSGKNAVSPVAHFNRDGSSASTCSGLNFPKKTNEVPAYLAAGPLANSTQTAVTDTLYLVTSSSSAGALWSWNTSQGNCSLVSTATIQNPLSGVAVGPAPVTLALQVTSSTANPAPTTFNFNSNLFQLTATGCTANVTAFPLIPATVNKMISLSGTSATTGFPDGATPAPNLGEGGYEIVYVAHWLFPAVNPGCTSVFSDGLFETSIFGFYDNNLYSNPRTVRCDNGDATMVTQSTEPQIVGGVTACAGTQSVGVYPIGGPIPGDQGITVKNSFFGTVNAGLTNAEPGTFCGLQSPLTNTLDPSNAAVFNPAVTNTIPVKFKLATASGSCKNGPFITDAVALLSVAQIADSAGATVFNAIRVNPTASSLDQAPLFNSGNQQYQFTLNISGFVSGTYSLTVTFLSDNTTNQTTLFKIQ